MTPDQQFRLLDKFRDVALTYFMLWPCSIVLPVIAVSNPNFRGELWPMVLIFAALVALYLGDDLRAWRSGRHWPLTARVFVPGGLAVFFAAMAALGG